MKIATTLVTHYKSLNRAKRISLAKKTAEENKNKLR
jgi:hypothetical protein